MPDSSGSSQKCTAATSKVLVIEEGKDYLLEAGDELPYRLLRSLGHGHSGNVEEVQDTRTGAIYARKTIRIYGPRDAHKRRRIFDNEIKIIRNLASHHHIVHVFATYVAKREVGLILQPVADEGDLDAFLDCLREDGDDEYVTERSSKMHQTRLAILQQAFGCLANGLAFMHRLRIRHKDIKPRNILIHQGSVLYTDFGYSLDSSQSSHSTTAGRPDFLTRRYSAPEVLEHDARNSQSDIFSLGCVFLEMLSVLDRSLAISPEKCFSEDLEGIHAQLSDDTIPSVNLRASLSDLCLQMTQSEPVDRIKASQLMFGIFMAAPDPAEYFCAKCKPSAYVELGSNEVARFFPARLSGGSPINSNSSRIHRFDTWKWSQKHSRQYCASYDIDGRVLQYFLGPRNPAYVWTPSEDPLSSPKTYDELQASSSTTSRPNQESPIVLPQSIQESIGGNKRRRLVRASDSVGVPEQMDLAYKCVHADHIPSFFVRGRMFNVLWKEPTGIAKPGQPRSFTNYNVVSLRRFVVVNPRGTFSQCIPVQTYTKQGALKPGLITQDHAVIYTGQLGTAAPPLLPGEGITKQPIRVEPHNGQMLEPESRINFGKPYAVEHNVLVVEVGMVASEHLNLLLAYFEDTMKSHSFQTASTNL